MKLLKICAGTVNALLLIRIVLRIVNITMIEWLTFSTASEWCTVVLGFLGFYFNMKLFNEASKGKKDDVIFVGSAVFCLLMGLNQVLEIYVISRI